MSGLRNGNNGLCAFVLASLISAQKPAQTGALQLVPPICDDCPRNTTKAPLFGSAARLTSVSNRFVPGGTPGPVCHMGRSKKILVPPPLLVHAVSDCAAPVSASVNLVPPTPTTVESDDSYSAWSGPFEL